MGITELFLDRSPGAKEMHLSEPGAPFLLHGRLRAFSASGA
jgi:hypothetical protein